MDPLKVLMFTNNSVAKPGYSFLGTSSSMQLFLLVLPLRNIEIKARCIIYVVHILGLWRIASGIGGILRGDHKNPRVMMGQPLLRFVLLHLSALEGAPNLLKWVALWAGYEACQT